MTSVLLLNQYFPPDAASTGRYASTIAARLSQRGYDVTAVVGQPSYVSGQATAPARETVDAVRVVRVGVGRRRGRESLARRVGGYIRYLAGAWWTARRMRPDLVLAFHNPPLIGLVALGVARRGRARLILVVLDVHPDIVIASRWIRLPRPLFCAWDALNRLALRRAATVVVLGDEMKRTLVEEKGVDARSVRVIPLWSEPALTPAPRDDAWRSEQGLDGELVVLCAGNMGVMQPLDALFEAMARLRGGEVSLVMIGDGVRRGDWERAAARLAPGQVRFLDRLPTAEFARAISASDAALVSLAPGMERLSVPSRSFTFLSAGRPVIALMSPQADVARLVRDAACGWIVTSADELSELLAELSADRERCREAGVRAHEAYRRSHDRTLLSDRYADLVADTLAPG